VASDAAAGRRPPRIVQVHLPPGTTAHQAAALTLGCVVGSHSYRVSSQARSPGTTTVRLVAPPGQPPQPLISAVARAQLLAQATGLARDLANTPSGHKDPAWLAGTAARLAATVPGLWATVRDERWLAEHGFGGVVAVGGGSARPPRLLELAWRPAEVTTEMRDTDEHLVLVGKGITFDTGGISIKPAQNMEDMKYDMSGAAAVLGTFEMLGRLKPAVHVIGLIPSTENMPSGNAVKPGDVITSHLGKTIEVINTDAEGRLILCDALSWARRYRPACVIDIATLTGAIVVALGNTAAGVMGTDDELVEEVRRAAERAGERVWPLPLWDEYRDLMKSDIADVKNTGGRPAGSISAGWFLREFVEGYPWAHLDIAGTAYTDREDPSRVKGPTGMGVRLFSELVLARAGGRPGTGAPNA
jgi:leucyl aminopeptidase